jgi:biofilm PGA synthesis N-glycosyltransferase PgaC
MAFKAAVLVGVITLAFLGYIIFYIDQVDVYASIACALVADGYIYYYSTEKARNKILLPRRRFPTLLGFLIIFPIVTSAILAWLGFLGHSLLEILNIITINGFSITFFLITVSIPLGLKELWQEKRRHAFDPTYRPLVSIIVPAYNEQRVIAHTIQSLLNQTYPRKEILIVDDGSTDHTSLIASQFAHRRVRVLRKPNGGKGSALNYGLLFARGKLVLTIDADSLLRPDALERMVRTMSDQSIAGSVGTIKALNYNSLLTKCQALEYISTFSLMRRALRFSGAINVISGAFGMFRREAIDDVGRFDNDSLAEDFGITIRIQKSYGFVGTDSQAVTDTEVPDTWKGLFKQRRRWALGTLQEIAKHPDGFLNERYGVLQKIIYPMILSTFIVPFASIFSLVAIILIGYYGGLVPFVGMFTVFFLLELLVVILGLILDEDKRYSLAWYSPLLVIGYRQFIDMVSIVSLFQYFRIRTRKASAKKLRWDSVERIGIGRDAINSPQEAAESENNQKDQAEEKEEWVTSHR